jgi:hypothetical protein
MRSHLPALAVKNLLIVIDWNLNVLRLVRRAHGRLNSVTTLRIDVGLALVLASRVENHLDNTLLILMIMLVLFLLKSLLWRLNLDCRSYVIARTKHHEAAIVVLPLPVDCRNSLTQVLGTRRHCGYLYRLRGHQLLGLENRWR